MNQKLALLILATLRVGATTVFGPDPNSPTYLAPGGTVTSGGVNLDGVVRIAIGSVGCSGALLSSGMHIITAAHCVDQGVQAGDVTVSFETLGGSFNRGVAAISINPGWTGAPNDELLGVDVAILTLTAPATGVSGYLLYSGVFEVGSVIEIAGYGISGVGVANAGVYPFGTRRYGLNLYDALGTAFAGGTAGVLLGDFDDGTAAHDAFGFLDAGLAHTGFGALEVSVAPGDSGGPSFLNGFLVGVHSFGGRLSTPGLPDIDAGPNPNFSFGEVFGDTRVSASAAWIESHFVPEPGTWAMLGIGLMGIALRARARR